ncbi:TPA: fimbrial protein [Enterobacter roggenkampii]|nr:fimbrial protein [Enterobacter roggenkampii]
MEINKILLAVTVAMGMSQVSLAHAEDQGHGQVKFHGMIIDSPCSIDDQSQDQTVELGQISDVALSNGGTSKPKSFNVMLKNCSISTASTVTTTFTGLAGQDGKLGISGTASGAGIVLTDAAGNKIELAKPSSAHTLQNGDNTLSFAAYVQGDGASVTPGEFSSVADFTLAYQ